MSETPFRRLGLSAGVCKYLLAPPILPRRASILFFCPAHHIMPKGLCKAQTANFFLPLFCRRSRLHDFLQGGDPPFVPVFQMFSAKLTDDGNIVPAQTMNGKKAPPILEICLDIIGGSLEAGYHRRELPGKRAAQNQLFQLRRLFFLQQNLFPLLPFRDLILGDCDSAGTGNFRRAGDLPAAHMKKRKKRPGAKQNRRPRENPFEPFHLAPLSQPRLFAPAETARKPLPFKQSIAPSEPAVNSFQEVSPLFSGACGAASI